MQVIEVTGQAVHAVDDDGVTTTRKAQHEFQLGGDVHLGYTLTGRMSDNYCSNKSNVLRCWTDKEERS